MLKKCNFYIMRNGDGSFDITTIHIIGKSLIQAMAVRAKTSVKLVNQLLLGILILISLTLHANISLKLLSKYWLFEILIK